MKLLPDDMICFALYSASHAIQQTYRDLLDPLGLTYPQYLVMRVLWAQDEPPTVKDIGAHVQLDSSTVTPLLKRLEKAGLIVRKRDLADERQVRIALTPAGLDLQQQASAIPKCIYDHIGKSPEDIVRLRDELIGLSRHLRETSSS